MLSEMSTVPSTKLRLVPAQRKQRTLASVVSFSGTGLHTGHPVNMRFLPAPVGTGVVFQRTDLPNTPSIPAEVQHVVATPRSTVIGIGEARVGTVEHVLSALAALQVDNVVVELDQDEPPVGDGSAKPFVEMILQAGIQEQGSEAQLYEVLEPIFYANEQAQVVALPYDGFRVSYTLDHPEVPLIGSQFMSMDMCRDVFVDKIATSRTFCMLDWVEALQKQGLIKGGNLENALVIKDNQVLSKEGLRFPNEPVRHKILDLIGDLALLGKPLKAHLIAIRSGHMANVAFVRRMLGEE